MPPSIRFSPPPTPDPVEFSVEDAVLNTWIEDTSVYLCLDAAEITAREEPPDQG